MSMFKTGRFREALDIYKRSLQLNPDKETLQKKISDLLKKKQSLTDRVVYIG